ncbi:hypothetical protein GJ496_007559 [Pomphorhynchus laevis]|nr:hypothetical protein GJ496_007559 [Pomphorhynchus laevis]
MLTSNIVKGVKTGFPLGITADKVIVQQKNFNADFIKSIMKKIDWPVFIDAAKQLGYDDGLNRDNPPHFDSSHAIPNDKENVMQKIHRALLEVDIIEGELICPESGRKFPIKNGIPNMLLEKDEYESSDE